MIGPQLFFSVNRNLACDLADRFFSFSQVRAVAHLFNLLLHVQKTTALSQSPWWEPIAACYAPTCCYHGNVTQQASAEVTVMSFGCR